MVKTIFFLLAITLTACNSGEKRSIKKENNNAILTESTGVADKVSKDTSMTFAPADTALAKTYSNERFKQVTIKMIGEHRFKVQGKGQIFESSFGWVVEDGHEEIQKGFQMTDAGAPEWGNFNFTVDVAKKRINSTLHLILFEASAKDGSRQHALPIRLY
jgi:hypothetical protein